MMYSNTLAQWEEVGPLASLGSGGQGAHIVPPRHLFCHAVAEFLNKSFFFLMISYNKMLMYILEFFWAETIKGSWWSTAIFKSCIWVNGCRTPNTIVLQVACASNFSHSHFAYHISYPKLLCLVKFFAWQGTSANRRGSPSRGTVRWRIWKSWQIWIRSVSTGHRRCYRRP